MIIIFGYQRFLYNEATYTIAKRMLVLRVIIVG